MSLARRTLIPTAAALLLAAPAHAQNLIANGSFETPGLQGTVALFGGGSTIGGPTPGTRWTVLGTDVAVLRDDYNEGFNGVGSWPAAEGRQFADLTGTGGGNSANGIEQVVGTTVGNRYRLDFQLGRALSSFTGSPFYSAIPRLDLQIDGGARIQFTNDASTPIGSVNWRPFVFEFTAANAQTTVRFFRGDGGASPSLVGLDAVSLTDITATSAVIPEPSTYALLGTGLGALGLASRRRRRAVG